MQAAAEGHVDLAIDRRRLDFPVFDRDRLWPGDLDQRHELEVGDTSLVGQLIALCATKLHGQPEIHASVMEKLTSIINGQVQSISLDGLGLTDDAGADDDFG